MLFGNFQIFNIYFAKCLEKIWREINEPKLNDTQAEWVCPDFQRFCEAFHRFFSDFHVFFSNFQGFSRIFTKSSDFKSFGVCLHSMHPLPPPTPLISGLSGRDGIFAKSPWCDTSRQSAQMWNSHSPECGNTSPNWEIATAVASLSLYSWWSILRLVSMQK